MHVLFSSLSVAPSKIPNYLTRWAAEKGTEARNSLSIRGLATTSSQVELVARFSSTIRANFPQIIFSQRHSVLLALREATLFLLFCSPPRSFLRGKVSARSVSCRPLRPPPSTASVLKGGGGDVKELSRQGGGKSPSSRGFLRRPPLRTDRAEEAEVAAVLFFTSFRTELS